MKRYWGISLVTLLIFGFLYWFFLGVFANDSLNTVITKSSEEPTVISLKIFPPTNTEKLTVNWPGEFLGGSFGKHGGYVAIEKPEKETLFMVTCTHWNGKVTRYAMRIPAASN